MVGLLRIAPAARAVAVGPTRLLVVALTNVDADGLTNAFTSANPTKTSAAAASTLMPSIVLVNAAPETSEEAAASNVCDVRQINMYVRVHPARRMPHAHMSKGVPQREH